MKIVLFVTLGLIMLSSGCVGAKPVHPPVQNSNITASNISQNTTPSTPSPPWPNLEVFIDETQPINVTVGQEFVIRYDFFNQMAALFTVNYSSPELVTLLDRSEERTAQLSLDGVVWFRFMAVAPGTANITITEQGHLMPTGFLSQKTFKINIAPPRPNISANYTGNPWPSVEVFTNLFTNQNPSVNVTLGQEFVIPYNQFTSSNITFQPANIVIVESKQFVQNPGALIPDGTTWILFKAVALGSTKISVTETTRFGDPLQTKTLTINIFPTEVNASAATAIYIHVSPPGGGSVSPSTGNYTYGTNVTFIATPAAGYVFFSWWYGYEDSTGGRGGIIGKNATLNLPVERSENVTAYFVALPVNWNNAVSLGQVHRPIAVGEYFYISHDYIAGQFGPDSVNATFDESLVAFIDRKDAGSVGPLTPGMHSASVWLLFKALRPGIANISVTQIRNNYSDPPKTYSVTIGN